MKKEVEEEVKRLIKKIKSCCSVEEFKNKLDWERISLHPDSLYKDLSEDFIIEFKNKVNWNLVSYDKNLSENFIREFQDKVDWTNVFQYQKLSKEFVVENINRAINFVDKMDNDDLALTYLGEKVVIIVNDEKLRQEKIRQKELNKLENLKTLRQKQCSINSILSLEV